MPINCKSNCFGKRRVPKVRTASEFLICPLGTFTVFALHSNANWRLSQLGTVLWRVRPLQMGRYTSAQGWTLSGKKGQRRRAHFSWPLSSSWLFSLCSVTAFSQQTNHLIWPYRWPASFGLSFVQVCKSATWQLCTFTCAADKVPLSLALQEFNKCKYTVRCRMLLQCNKCKDSAEK